MSAIFRLIWIEANYRFIGAHYWVQIQQYCVWLPEMGHLNIIEADSVCIVSDVLDLNSISIWLLLKPIQIDCGWLLWLIADYCSWFSFSRPSYLKAHQFVIFSHLLPSLNMMDFILWTFGLYLCLSMDCSWIFTLDLWTLLSYYHCEHLDLTFVSIYGLYHGLLIWIYGLFCLPLWTFGFNICVYLWIISWTFRLDFFG